MRSASRFAFFPVSRSGKPPVTDRSWGQKGYKIPMLIQSILYRFFYIYVNLNILASIPYTAMLLVILMHQGHSFTKMVR